MRIAFGTAQHPVPDSIIQKPGYSSRLQQTDPILNTCLNIVCGTNATSPLSRLTQILATSHKLPNQMTRNDDERCLDSDRGQGDLGVEEIHNGPRIKSELSCTHQCQGRHHISIRSERARERETYMAGEDKPFPFSLLLSHLQTDKSRINVSGHFLLQRQSPQPLVIQGGRDEAVKTQRLMCSSCSRQGNEKEGRKVRVCVGWGGEGGWRVANGGGDSNNDARNGLTQCYHPPHLTAPSPPTAPPCLKTSRKVETEASLV
ncbi:hypothetical protein C0Q70_06809 [Pomacea canaliculata]|uniref:Uncharacterized protein n=1 Tax=Pomacea canaliculata TaxID=400727 RepID=A0A2T7PDA3_POMCA|nr:hypothetical protein C0Q70_06809 [Pomacea canaliculata]